MLGQHAADAGGQEGHAAPMPMEEVVQAAPNWPVRGQCPRREVMARIQRAGLAIVHAWTMQLGIAFGHTLR
ncbi:hypothetical protein ACFQU7_18285 [Pseudoroseomonas wenyumeiae]